MKSTYPVTRPALEELDISTNDLNLITVYRFLKCRRLRTKFKQTVLRLLTAEPSAAKQIAICLRCEKVKPCK